MQLAEDMAGFGEIDEGGIDVGVYGMLCDRFLLDKDK